MIQFSPLVIKKISTHLSHWMLEAWLLLLLRLCSVMRLSSSSSSMRKGCDEVGSSSGQEYCWRKGWDNAASAVRRSMGLKVKIRSRKSTAGRGKEGVRVKPKLYVLDLQTSSHDSSITSSVTGQKSCGFLYLFFSLLALPLFVPFIL